MKKGQYQCWMIFDEKERMVGVYRTYDEAKNKCFDTDTVVKAKVEAQ